MRYLGGVLTPQNLVTAARLRMYVSADGGISLWPSAFRESAWISPWPKGTQGITFGKTEQGGPLIEVSLGAQTVRFAYEGEADLAKLEGDLRSDHRLPRPSSS